MEALSPINLCRLYPWCVRGGRPPLDETDFPHEHGGGLVGYMFSFRGRSGSIQTTHLNRSQSLQNTRLWHCLTKYTQRRTMLPFKSTHPTRCEQDEVKNNGLSREEAESARGRSPRLDATVSATTSLIDPPIRPQLIKLRRDGKHCNLVE